MSAQLAPIYREQLAAWAEHGVPDDQSTRQIAVDIILPKLWAAYESLAACLSDLAALHEPVPAADLAECLPYSGAGPEEGQAVLDALEDRGWRIVREVEQ